MNLEFVQPPPNAVWLAFNGVYGLMAVPWCPHEGCGWSMPELYCPDHGNFGMTFLDCRRGAVTWVKAVLDIPRESLAQTRARAARSLAYFRSMTREDRYEEIVGITMPRRDGSSLVPQVNVLRCRSCGSLLLTGDEDIHERLHPPVTWSDGPSLVELDAYGDYAPERS